MHETKLHHVSVKMVSLWCTIRFECGRLVYRSHSPQRFGKHIGHSSLLDVATEPCRVICLCFSANTRDLELSGRDWSRRYAPLTFENIFIVEIISSFSVKQYVLAKVSNWHGYLVCTVFCKFSLFTFFLWELDV